MILGNVLSDVFKKNKKDCFFCKVELKKEETFTLQYSSKDGLHSEKICNECATTLNEMVDTMDEINDSRL